MALLTSPSLVSPPIFAFAGVPFEKIENSIFSVFSEEELSKIKLLGFTNIEYIQFIREMLYFDTEERETLIENMLKSRGKSGEEIFYISPLKTIELSDAIRVFLVSLIESGSKKKLCIIETSETISEVKERVGEGSCLKIFIV